MGPWPALSQDNCWLRQERFVLVFYFPRHTHVSAQQRLVDCSLSVSRSPDRIGPSLHRFGVAHQTSLRSLLTVMSSSNSPHLGEAGRLFRVLVTAPQDRFYRSIRADGIASSQKGAIPLSTIKSDSLA
jgi:hypothetical protein